MSTRSVVSSTSMRRGLLCVLCASAVNVSSAGDLAPPAGPVAPTHKTLTQVEPRTLIDTIPFTISGPGSYYLARDLTGASGQSGIIITASNVTIDLNGFTLHGVAGSFWGIASFPGANDLIVRNGGVTGWGMSGIDLANASNGVIESIVASGNAQVGIRAGSNFIVSRCAAWSNGVGMGQNGLLANGHAVIADCAAFNNGGAGIGGGGDSVVRDCVARDNGTHGITVGDRCTVSGCTASSNDQDGIRANAGCTITGCTSGSNNFDGIRALELCRITANLCQSNGPGANSGAGVHVTGSVNHIEGNTVLQNDRGIDVDAGGNLIIRNSANFNTNDFDIAGGNSTGPIVTSATIGASTNPHANYSF